MRKQHSREFTALAKNKLSSGGLISMKFNLPVTQLKQITVSGCLLAVPLAIA